MVRLATTPSPEAAGPDPELDRLRRLMEHIDPADRFRIVDDDGEVVEATGEELLTTAHQLLRLAEAEGPGDGDGESLARAIIAYLAGR